MESTLKLLEHRIMELFNDAANPEKYSAFDFTCFSDDLQVLYEMIRRAVIDHAFKESDHRKVEMLIQLHQRQIVDLADKLEIKLQARKNEKAQSEYYRNALQLATHQVEKILTFLEQNFPHYLNMNERVPVGYKKLLQREMKQVLKQLKSELTHIIFDDEFWQIIFQPAEALLQSANNKPFSYHDMWYLKRMYDDLFTDFRNIKQTDSFNRMISFLVGINFNSSFFIHYITKQIAVTVTHCENLNNQIEKLSWWHKEIAHLFQTVSTPFIPAAPGAKAAILDWIGEEIKYLERVHQLALVMPPVQEETMPASKFMTTLSVPEFACLIRLMVEKKIIDHPNKQEMLNFFSKNFKTRNAQSISQRSLSNNYYSVAAKSIKAVRDLFLELVNETRKFD